METIIWDGDKRKVKSVKKVVIDTDIGELVIDMEKLYIFKQNGKIQPLSDDWAFWDTVEAVSELLAREVPENL